MLLSLPKYVAEFTEVCYNKIVITNKLLFLYLREGLSKSLFWVKKTKKDSWDYLSLLLFKTQ